MAIGSELEAKLLVEIPSEDSTSLEEKMILHDAIIKLKPKVVIETGTHRGLTTLYMAEALRQNNEGHLWTYDPFEWGARGNFRKFGDIEPFITYEQKPGKDIDVTGLDFVFIDGYHEKAQVLAEIDAIFPRLNVGAHVYFHDTNGSNESCDVPGAISERGLEVEFIKTINGMAKYVHKDNGDNSIDSSRRAKRRVSNAKKTDSAA